MLHLLLVARVCSLVAAIALFGAVIWAALESVVFCVHGSDLTLITHSISIRWLYDMVISQCDVDCPA